MQKTIAIGSLAITVALCWLLDGKQLKPIPMAFGRVLDPFHGLWQNMEGGEIPPVVTGWEAEAPLGGLKGSVTIRYDSLRIPHIFAENAHDLYFAQGYVTARDRLWQMEFQTYAAAGRLSEILDDPRVLAMDRAARRTGMVYAAEQSRRAMEADPESRHIVQAYAEGVNAWIQRLSYATYPLEYKLLDHRPEEWTTLKTALLLKYMAWDLTGRSDDFDHTNAAAALGDSAFSRLYQDFSSLSSPIIPRGTAWGFSPVPVQAPDTFLRASRAPNFLYPQPDPMNGSNNWVVAPSKTALGHPILCNDPHLRLSLPSVWYEVQLSMPGLNVYGVSLPGAPAVIIGFNRDIAWGVTNASRDVLDWYGIEFQDASRKAYKFEGGWLPTRERVEVIRRRYGPDLRDTILFTQHGPVVYDRTYSDPDSAGPIDVAMRWAGHDSTNEIMTFVKLNRAQGHADYRDALSGYACPAQNFIFAGRDGDIAITQQGRFPVKWKGQGQVVMDGSDRLHLWQAYIPSAHNPHALNPARGFLFSSNQPATDTAYPYTIPGDYDHTRNLRIASVLEGMAGITVEDMMRLQCDNYNQLAAIGLKTLLGSLDDLHLSEAGKQASAVLHGWNLMNDHDLEAPSIFQAWTNHLQAMIWEDDLQEIGRRSRAPKLFTTMVGLADAAGLPNVDDRRTPEVEGLTTLATRSLNMAMEELEHFTQTEGVPYTWQNYNNVQVRHFTRQKALGFERLPIGGNAGSVNANRKNTGASWRMVVQMGEEPLAYGSYPGGESGNPGSRYFASGIPSWAAGRYHRLLLLRSPRQDDPALQFTQILQPR